MTPRIGDLAPDFTLDSTIGRIDFHDWSDSSWVFLFSHPADFTPVCTTEMGRTAQLKHEFEARNTKPIGLSTDKLSAHKTWTNDINRTHHTKIDFPILSDPNYDIARLYGMMHPQESTTEAVRSVFIIDSLKRIRLTMAYPMNIGRNFNEILRVIDALQLADKKQIATPADWKNGDKVIIPPSIPNSDAKLLFPQGWDEITTYYRTVQLNQ